MNTGRQTRVAGPAGSAGSTGSAGPMQRGPCGAASRSSSPSVSPSSSSSFSSPSSSSPPHLLARVSLRRLALAAAWDPGPRSPTPRLEVLQERRPRGRLTTRPRLRPRPRRLPARRFLSRRCPAWLLMHVRWPRASICPRRRCPPRRNRVRC
jgi:hypothetical protein